MVNGMQNDAQSQQDAPATSQQRQDFLWKTDEYLANYARFADTKAGFVGALAISLFGWVLSTHALSPVLRAWPAVWPLSTWFSVAAGGLLLGSAGLAIWSIYPRLRSTKDKGFVFWGNIGAFGSSAAFKAAVKGIRPEDLSAELAQHVYDVAAFVCIPKYRSVSWAIRLFVLGALNQGAAMLIAHWRR